MSKKIHLAVACFALLCSAQLVSAATPESRVVLVKTKSSSAVYALVNNQRVPISSPADVAAKGYSWKNLKIISDKKMRALPLAPGQSTGDGAAQTVAAQPPLATPSPQSTSPAPVAPSVPLVTASQAAPVVSPSPSSAPVLASEVPATPSVAQVVVVAPNTRTEFSIVPIPQSGGGLATGLNNKGEVFEREYDIADPGIINDFVFLGGKKISVARAPEGYYPLERALNDSGVGGEVLEGPGNSYTLQSIDSTGKRAAIKKFGSMMHIGTLRINNVGQMSGRAEVPCKTVGEDGGCMHAFVTEKGAMKDLGFGEAVGINDSGSVVYNSGKHVWLYQNGAKTDLGTFGGTSAYAADINNSGQIAGIRYGAETADGKHLPNAFVWSGGEAQSFYFREIKDLNNIGEVVGIVDYDGRTADDVPRELRFRNAQHAAVWKNGVVTDLNTLLPPGSNTILTEAIKINDAEQVLVGGYTYGATDEQYFLVSLPASIGQK